MDGAWCTVCLFLMGKGIGKGKYRLDRLFFVAEQQILGLHYTAQTTQPGIQTPNRTKKMVGTGFTKNQKNQLVFGLKLKIQILRKKTG
jgi:hypothetical protein